jgi:hypothetical protein
MLNDGFDATGQVIHVVSPKQQEASQPPSPKHLTCDFWIGQRFTALNKKWFGKLQTLLG